MDLGVEGATYVGSDSLFAFFFLGELDCLRLD